MTEPMFALSIRQPYATMVALGVKDVENRNWTTDYRGPLAIHASAAPADFDLHTLSIMEDLAAITEADGTDHCRYLTMDADGRLLLRPELVEIGQLSAQYRLLMLMIDEGDEGAFPESAIIGTVDLVDVVQDHDSPWADKNCFKWLLANPRPLRQPLTNVCGKLRLWKLPSTIHIP